MEIPETIERETPPSRTPDPAARYTWILLAVVVGAIFLAFTPYTNNLDDIKATLLHVGGGGLLVLFCALWTMGRLELPHRSITLALGLWFASLLLSTCLNALRLLPNANPYQWIGWIQIGQYLALLGIFLVQAATARNPRLLEWTLLYWVAVVVVQGVFGLIHLSGAFGALYTQLYGGATSASPFASLLAAFNSSHDMIGTLLNRAFFIDLMVLWAPLCLAGVLIWKDLPRRLFALAALLLSAAGSALTFSLAGILAYAAGLALSVLGIVWMRSERRPRITRTTCLATVAAAAVILAVAALRPDYVAAQFTRFATSPRAHFLIWKGGLGIFADHPVFGAGPGAFRILFPQYRNPDYHLTSITNVTQFSFNQLVDLLSEQGVVGTALYVAFLWILFRRGIRVMRNGGDDRLKVIAVAAMAGAAAFLATSLVHSCIRWPIGAVSFWAILGLIAGVGEIRKNAAVPAPEESASGNVEPASSVATPPGTIGSAPPLSRACVLVLAFVLWINPLPKSHPFLYSNAGYGIRYFVGAKQNNDGLIYSEADRPQEAAQAFTRAIEWNPTFPTSYYKKAHAQNLLNDTQGALDTYETLARLAPDYSEIRYNLGVIHRLLADRDFDEAARTSDQDKKKALDEYAKTHLAESLEQYAIAAKLCNKISIQYSYAGALQKSADATDDPARHRQLLLQAADLYDRVKDLPLTWALQEIDQGQQENQMKASAAQLAPRLREQARETSKATGS